jgi:hypothetical protein
MASKAPPIPPEQRSHPGDGPDVAGSGRDRREDTTGLQSGQPGDADVNLEQQGRHGGINQNTHHQGYQQDR